MARLKFIDSKRRITIFLIMRFIRIARKAAWSYLINTLMLISPYFASAYH